ncbi:acetyl/propionyl/methylcrotonyl-CoA carboxylase subunit alpha [Burkholderia multivorans]|jgi:3-methylcrotonyl-CoA carboxylase alpha subunit|uniref:acetyl/propionyl/methylcrotonyl-CoA carboxylase subunit alpha n=1 Tax=Burkholderia multivorans TaxID=87883 RepID=UPI00057D2663|nr:acetyl/propionyl/methylcrotonyl-CoA carboxylase subunit alpha [Burkholderia multivorans]KHS09722.1 3-methylcrotonyl-CoA carboxylase [Burkholderia multivorans]KHS15249.1 3-methylcrotonyl-CoA carboxylase [Burkholderia multivorans]MBR7923380.1 acetyl/propionyl/methylcrotonyl-CoA carboxylase subunit alpha [Burkholderia multivorans]MBR8106011.1 acetyl/propionyl/methylcrotonyl-CoA carboxylase subunit alpha [Burkholderia multivorans]MBR8341241.1 acetyl/propionyl/methylcrotonyl-CoA carboxylase subu
MFDKILIANRGEIACRVAATCKRLGIASVAVYSDADANAKHVAACDEAVHIGGSAAADSYLRIERIIEAARATGAQAIHPGYGFLSENEDFAQACAAAGIVFIGPPVDAIAAMGSKAAAKALMHAAAVPLVPGYHGDDQNPATLHREADAIGYPVLLKASAGGGGKGMRVVERSDDFPAALASCQREAASSFGNDRVLIEKYLTRPRHVEVQVFGDTHGNTVYLFDRDCSVQRRHQKVLEEAPAPGLSEDVRRAMGEAAVAAARAVGYVGAGTVEFIMTGDAFYFMEMNTRLQVEHPVTEMVTGLDLVEWQLRVAAGEPLPLKQDELRVQGHAIEARLYAENPSRGFLPSTGTLKHLRLPDGVEFDIGAPVRVDSGVREGDAITPFYDPMIAKLIVHGADRDEALGRMLRALRACEVVGLHTNAGFLQRIVACEPFATADLDTGLIERNHDVLFAPQQPPRASLALACAALLARERDAAGDGSSPWSALSDWRLNAGYRRTFEWHAVEREADVTVAYDHDGTAARIAVGDAAAQSFAWSRGATPLDFDVLLDGVRSSGRVIVDGDSFHVFTQGTAETFEWRNLLAHAGDAEHGGGRLTAPMPGKVIAVLVEPGQRVEPGTPLIVMEAMKMEHTIGAPSAGVVAEVLYAVGDQVADGAQLLVMAEAEAARA